MQIQLILFVVKMRFAEFFSITKYYEHTLPKILIFKLIRSLVLLYLTYPVFAKINQSRVISLELKDLQSTVPRNGQNAKKIA